MTTISIEDRTVTSSSSVTTVNIPPPASSIGSSASAYTCRTMALREVRDYTQHLVGRVKTIIDAAISDPQQNKAVKNLVHDAFWTEHYEAVRAWAEAEVSSFARNDGDTAVSNEIHPFPFTTDHKLPVSI